MNNLKFKKARSRKKSNDLLNKQRRKLKKKSGKSKKEKNLKLLKERSNCVDQLFFQNYKQFLPNGLGRLRAKGKQGAEGMFFKGLRSDYITRESLNEANEARKNEDINKIIDLGRVFLQKKEGPRRTSKRIAAGTEKSTNLFENVSEDLGQCPLSPISIDITFEENCSEDSKSKKNDWKKLDLEKEWATFLSKYEETVDLQVLRKLPEKGVLEDAIEALKKLQKITLDDFEGGELKGNETEFVKELKFLNDEFEQENPAGEDFIENFVFSEKFLFRESRYNYENFGKKPLGNELFMNDVKSNNSYLPFLDNDADCESLDVLRFQEEDFEKQAKELNIVTPPFQFYRRNMF